MRRGDDTFIIMLAGLAAISFFLLYAVCLNAL